jgi:alpha/beta superfamily hydrolase
MATQLIAGPVGDLEVALDWPPQLAQDQPPRALALVCHPHPLHGGTMDNKVVTTLSRACTAQGCAVVRLNYRGVGRSQGVFDATVGETDDAASALAWLQAQCAPDGAALPIVLCGFSFGTAVAARLAQRLPSGQLIAMVLAGAAVQRFATLHVDTDLTLMVHGELDETVPLTETLAWAAPQSLPISVVPGADHFFNRQLLPLRDLTLRHLRAFLPATSVASPS